MSQTASSIAAIGEHSEAIMIESPMIMIASVRAALLQFTWRQWSQLGIAGEKQRPKCTRRQFWRNIEIGIAASRAALAASGNSSPIQRHAPRIVGPHLLRPMFRVIADAEPHGLRGNRFGQTAHRREVLRQASDPSTLGLTTCEVRAAASLPCERTIHG